MGFDIALMIAFHPKNPEDASHAQTPPFWRPLPSRALRVGGLHIDRSLFREIPEL
jgi:hypothetical protein